MAAPFRNVFVCCAAPRRNIDDELLVSAAPVSPLAQRRRRGLTPRTSNAVNQTHGSVWISRRASYSHTAKTSSNNRVPPVAKPIPERHHSVDIPHPLYADLNSARSTKCDTPSTAAPDTPTQPPAQPPTQPAESTPAKACKEETATSAIREIAPLPSKPKKTKKPKPSNFHYELSNQIVVNEASYASLTSSAPVLSRTAAPVVEAALPVPPLPSLTPDPVKFSTSPSPPLSPSPPQPQSPKSVFIPMKTSLPRKQQPPESTVIAVSSSSFGKVSSLSPVTKVSSLSPLNKLPSPPPAVTPSPAVTPRAPSGRLPEDVARSANFSVPHALTVSRRRLRPQAENPEAKHLAPPTTFDLTATAEYQRIAQDIEQSNRPDKEALLELVRSMGSLLVLRGLPVEEVWVTGKKFSRRKIHLFLSKDLGNFWWDVDIRYSCKVSDITGIFSWRQMLRLSRLHPFLMSDPIRELCDDERRRLVAFEAVNHNGYLTRHWFLCSSTKTADELVRSLGLFKM
eukprot:Gregarina_sp_Pseudo_9__10@NODE_1007_length_1974_cov_33_564341_g944_i0_p1_GENE_NODE_1007_length_1974_cov_33_564341_g944_i0NODE_1007_length_1974_cov_33_564341_g944_i0_p1_ORF_typecomplete_len511_score77_17_NODE_1007_length_1974_cov_33_564341_g944_i0591591